MLKPANEEELGVQLRFTVWLSGAAPDPDRETVVGEFAALLVTVTVPEKLPVVVGAKTTLKEVDCPAESVRGSARPLRLNPPPVRLSWESDTPELPVLVRVTTCVALVPVLVLAKATVEGDALSWRTGEMPVPERATTNGELGELFTSVRLPERLPAEAGAKLTANEDVPPGGTESGSARPERLKPAPDKSAWVRLRLAVPGLLTARVCDPVVPTDTLPKLVLAGITEI